MENLTSAQLAAFILGIIFSIFSVVAVLIAIKKTNKLKMSTGTLLLLMAMPFIAFVAWFYLAFSFIKGFGNKEFLTLMIAILSALVICIMIVVVSLALYKRSKKLMTENEISQIIEESADEEDYEDEDDELELKPQTVLVLPENTEVKISKADKASNLIEDKKEIEKDAPAEKIDNNLDKKEIEKDAPAEKIDVNLDKEVLTENETPAEELTLKEPPVDETVEQYEEETVESDEQNQESQETEQLDNTAEEQSIEDLDEEDLDKKFDELLEMLKNEPVIRDTDELDDMADDVIDDFQEDMGKKKSDKKDDE